MVGIDILESRFELARDLGADEVCSPASEGLPAGRHGEHSLDVALDCTGLKVSIEYLLDRTRRAVAIFGVVREVLEVNRSRLGQGMMLMGYPGHTREAAETALRLVEAGRLDLAALVSRRMPFSQYEEGVALLRQKEAVKIGFDPWMDG